MAEEPKEEFQTAPINIGQEKPSYSSDNLGSEAVEEPRTNNEVTLEDVEDWRKYFLRNHGYPSTNTYYSFLKQFVGIGTEINQKNIKKFQAERKSPPARAALKSFVEFLVEEKNFSPDLYMLRYFKTKTTKKFPESYSRSQIELLINNMESLLTKLMTIFIYQCGLRISEAVTITWNDLNYSEWLKNQSEYGKLNIRQAKGDKFRQVIVPPESMKLLYEMHSDRDANGIPKGHLVFPIKSVQDPTMVVMSFLDNKSHPKEENQYQYIVFASNAYRKELYRVSKKVLGRRISPHKLRHSFAQHLMDDGLPIDSLKELLGHSSYESTNVYARASTTKILRDLKVIRDKENEKK